MQPSENTSTERLVLFPLTPIGDASDNYHHCKMMDRQLTFAPSLPALAILHFWDLPQLFSPKPTELLSVLRPKLLLWPVSYFPELVLPQMRMLVPELSRNAKVLHQIKIHISLAKPHHYYSWQQVQQLEVLHQYPSSRQGQEVLL